MHKKFFLILIMLNARCARDNVGKSRETITPEQRAEEKMNAEEYQEAIDILQPLVDADPESYKRYPLLASAYAGLAGVDIVAILKQMLAGGAGDSALTMLLDFIPDDIDEDRVDTLKSGVDLLQAIPKDLIGPDGDPDYGSSAELQIVLYQTIYSTMLLRLTFDFDANGNIDPESLADLTIADAARILAALRGAAASAQGENAQVISAQAQETIDAIDASEGDDDSERLNNYLESQGA